MDLNNLLELSFLFNFGANRFYPKSDPTEGTNIDYGSVVNFPPKVSIFALEVISNNIMGLEVKISSFWITPPRVTGHTDDITEGKGLFGENTLILDLTSRYSETDNFGEGVHTERSADFLAGTVFSSISAHFEVTYSINVRDYNTFAG